MPTERKPHQATAERLAEHRLYTLDVGKHELTPGVEFTFRTAYETTRVRFRAVVCKPGRQPWVDCWDLKNEQFRSIHPESVIRVHRTRTAKKEAS